MREAGHTSNPVDRLPVFIGAVILSGIGNLMYEISSQFSYMLGSSYGFSEGNQGDFIAAFFTGYTLIPVTMMFWIRRVDWRAIGFYASVTAAIGFFGLMFARSYLAILQCMFVAGIGMGASYALTLTVFGDSENPARGYGIKFFFDVVPGAAMNFLLPVIFRSFGFAGVASAVMGYALLGAASSWLLPGKGSKSATALAAPFSWRSERLAIIACFSCFLLIMGVMALWAFLGQIGDYKGFPASSLGSMLALGSLLNASGALLAAWLGNRAGRLAPVAVTLSLNTVMLVVLGASTGFGGFAIGALVFCLTNNFTLAYTMGMVASVDRHGRLVPFTSACFSAGAIFGPLMAGHLLEDYGLGSMLVLPAVAWLAALLAFAYCHSADSARGTSRPQRSSQSAAGID
jgi:hypothetical protein